MGYSADKTAYNSGINTDISTQTTPNSIPPEVVGAGYTDLADLLEPYINSINNQALLFGPTVPSNSLGVDLDLYFRQANPIEIYRKISGVWVLQGTLPLGFTLPEGNLTVRTSIDGFVVTATKGGWVISNTVYQKNTQTQLLVDPADLNFGRIDNIYANTSNNILYQVGIASVTPTAPILPVNTILIDQVIVPASSSGNDPYLLFGGGSPSDGETNFGNSTGLITGGVLTINADPTKFDVSQGAALFVDYTTPIPPTPPTVVNFGPLSGLTVTNLGSAISSYIGIDGDQVIHQQITPFTPTQRRSIATLGILIHSNLTNINAINTQGSNILSPANQLHDFIEAVGALNLNGNKYSNASTNLTIQKTAGSIFKFGCNSGDYTNPHQLSLSAGNPVTFRYRTRNGVETADTTNIIPGSYDNAGTIMAVGANQWTNQHITVFQSGLTRIQYGQNLYGNSAEALAASLTEAFAVEANIAANGIFRCILTIRGGASNLSITTDAIFSEVPKFGGSVGNAGSALTSANIIAALGYTPVDGPATSTDNAIARYDGTNGNVLQDSLVTILDDGNMISGSTGGNKLPTGTTAQRPSSLLDGYFRKNNTFSPTALEYYDLGSTTWRFLIDSTNLTLNAIINQNSASQSASFWIGGPAQIGGSTFSNIQPFEVVGTNSAPSTSGFSQNGSLRIRAISINSTILDSGINGTNNYSWIQSRDSSNYTTNRELWLNPNGGAVQIGNLNSINSTILVLRNGVTSSGGFSSVDYILDGVSTINNRRVVSNLESSISAGQSLFYFRQVNFDGSGGSFNFFKVFLNGLSSITSIAGTSQLQFRCGGTGDGTAGAQLTSNRNFIIQDGGTFTDAGFRLDVFGTSRFTGSNAAPASSGSAVASSLRLEATGNNGTVLRGGVDATNSYSWLQSSSGTDFSVNRELRLNPNGAAVIIGSLNSGSPAALFGVRSNDSNANSQNRIELRNEAILLNNKSITITLENRNNTLSDFYIRHNSFDGTNFYNAFLVNLNSTSSSTTINTPTNINFRTGTQTSGLGVLAAHINSTGNFFLDTVPATAGAIGTYDDIVRNTTTGALEKRSVTLANAQYIFNQNSGLQTASFTISGSGSASFFQANGTNGVADFLITNAGGNLNRWNIRKVNTESGSNSGSDLAFARYNDAGSPIDDVFIIKRSTGNVGIGIAPTERLHVNGNALFSNDIIIQTNPTTSTTGYDVLNRNTATGVIEKTSILTGIATYDPPSIAAGAYVEGDLTITGAAMGDYVQISFSNDISGHTLTAFVQSANTVRYHLRNDTGSSSDLASGSLRVRITKI